MQSCKYPSGLLLCWIYIAAILPNWALKYILLRRPALRGRADILLPLLLGFEVQDTLVHCYRFRLMPMTAASYEFQLALWEQAEPEDGYSIFDFESFRRRGMFRSAGYAILEIRPANSLYEQLSDLKRQWERFRASDAPRFLDPSDLAFET
jgi:hypothetical protein